MYEEQSNNTQESFTEVFKLNFRINITKKKMMGENNYSLPQQMLQRNISKTFTKFLQHIDFETAQNLTIAG